MDGFFSRFAWGWLERRPSEFPLTTAAAAIGPFSHPKAKKTWTSHAGHPRTLAPHRVSPLGRDEQVGPSQGS